MEAASQAQQIKRLSGTVNTANGTTSYTWDAQGNLASKAGVQYTFDYGNRLRSDSSSPRRLG